MARQGWASRLEGKLLLGQQVRCRDGEVFRYGFFTNGTCTGNASATDLVALSGGKVPSSTATGALAAGHYSFLAWYGGDPNYNPSGGCETFSVRNG